MSHVAVSFEIPEYTANTDALGTLRVLDAVKLLGLEKKQRFTKHQPLNCTAKFKKHHKKKLPHFILVLLTLLLKCMPIGLR